MQMHITQQICNMWPIPQWNSMQSLKTVHTASWMGLENITLREKPT